MVVFLSILVLWVISLCLHEYAHARVAYAGGDYTVEQKGYLTLNPLRYMHPMMSIVIPLIVLAIGGVPLPGGAVYIERHRLRGPKWDSAVSAAGPATNLALFVLACLPFTFGLAGDSGGAGTIWTTLAFFAYLQAFATVLNLLPVPGLDGFGIIAPWLPYTWRRNAYQMGNVFLIALIIVLINRNPLSEGLSYLTVKLPLLMGVPFPTLLAGETEFRSALPWLR
jgi:Zn-dependent protease